MTTASETNATPLALPQSVAQRLGEVLLIVLVFFVLAGDPPPHVNETHYLCRVKHYWNPAWCAGDLFLESSDAQTLFIWMFGWLTQWVSLSATAWIGRLLVWTLVAAAWQRLSWRVVPMPLASVLSAALFVTLNAQAQFAGEWIVGGVEAKSFAYGFVLLALRELLDQRWNRLWLLLCAATAIHPLVGGWSAVICGALWLIGKVEKGDRSIFGWRKLGETARHAKNGPVPFFGLVGGGLLALIGIIPALSLTWNEPADVVAKASRIYVFERLPHHLALLTLPPDEITTRLICHGLLLISVVGLGLALRRHAARRIVQFAYGAAALAIAGLAIEVVFSHEPLFAARLLRYYWYRLTDFAAPMAAALSATALILHAMAQRKTWATLALLAAVLFPGWHLTNVARQRLLEPVPPADARMTDYEAWVDVCGWIAQNTSAESLFLTPRLNHSFKWRTGRPEVVNRKDIPQDARSIIEWDRRLKDIYYFESTTGLSGPVDSLGQFGTERVQELGKKYRADFVLSDRTQLLALPRAYWNEEYVVYRIEN
jgi:hypothetical protein